MRAACDPIDVEVRGFPRQLIARLLLQLVQSAAIAAQEHGMSRGRHAEQARILAAELRGALVADGLAGAGGVLVWV